MYPEFVMPEEQWKDFVADRQGVIVGEDWSSDSAGRSATTYPSRRPSYLGGGSMGIQHPRHLSRQARQADDRPNSGCRTSTLEKAPPYWQGLVGWYMVRVTIRTRRCGSPRRSTRVRQLAWETQTQTE